MNRLLSYSAFFLLVALFAAPSGVMAKTSRANVIITAPERNAVYDRTQKMPLSWSATGLTTDAVVTIDIKLKKQDRSGPPVGAVSGGGYQYVVHPNAPQGTQYVDWGLNDTIPGTYAITAQLHECSKNGCDYSPPGKAISKKTKPFTVTITNRAGAKPVSVAGTTVEITSPDGRDEYTAGSNKKLTIKWNAENVPDGSRVCTTLIKQRTMGSFAFPGGGGSCKKVKEGSGSMNGRLIRSSGYDLGPGAYWAHVTITGPETRNGKDAATLAEDTSDLFLLK